MINSNEHFIVCNIHPSSRLKEFFGVNEHKEMMRHLIGSLDRSVCISDVEKVSYFGTERQIVMRINYDLSANKSIECTFMVSGRMAPDGKKIIAHLTWAGTPGSFGNNRIGRGAGGKASQGGSIRTLDCTKGIKSPTNLKSSAIRSY